MSGVTMPALAWRSRPTAAAGAFGIYICTASGDTARMPRSLKMKYFRTASSVVPIAVPIDDPQPASCRSVSSRPAEAHNRG